MTNRMFDTQSEHDNVIKYAFTTLDKTSHDVYTNPGSQKNTSVNGFYPDIIITDKGEARVKFILEVETEDSITQNEITQWRDYLKLGGIFYLVVPKKSRQKAELLCRQNNLKARFATYSKDVFGNITNLNYE